MESLGGSQKIAYSIRMKKSVWIGLLLFTLIIAIRYYKTTEGFGLGNACKKSSDCQKEGLPHKCVNNKCAKQDSSSTNTSFGTRSGK